MKSKPVTLQVSDIVKWFHEKELVVNPTFQRHSVWPSPAKTYLIDSILSNLPIPKIYLRTKINPKTQRSVREVVDGQQRIRAIVEFASNELKLTTRSEQYSGMCYQDLDEDTQRDFLSYHITAEQLFNASDDDVIDVFARLNSYTVTLNAAEKRHAEFQTNFKHAVRRASQDWRRFIEKYAIFTVKQRFRMNDDQFMAELFGVLLNGVTDGGATKLGKLYSQQEDAVFTEHTEKSVRKKLDTCLTYLDEHFEGPLQGVFAKHYHLYTMFTVIALVRFGIPIGDLQKPQPRPKLAKADVILTRLSALERALESDEPPKKYREFVEACSSSTQRIKSRRVRLATFLSVLAE